MAELPPISKTIDPKLSITNAEQALALEKAFDETFGPLADKSTEDVKTAEPKEAAASGEVEEQPKEEALLAEEGATPSEPAREITAPAEAPAEPASAKHPDDEPDEEIDKFKLRPETHPESLHVFRELRGMLKSERRKTFDLETQLKKEVAERGPRPVSDPGVQKEIEDLRQFYQKHAIFDDSTYQVQYENPVRAQFDSIIGDIKAISNDPAAAGEWEKQMRSLGPDRIEKQYWNEGVLSQIGDPLDRDRLLRKVSALMELQDKRNRFRQEIAEQPDAYAKFQHQQAADYWANFGREAEEEMKKVTPTLGEWAAPKDLKSAKTTTEKAAMETHNAAYGEYEQLFREYLTDAATQGPRGMARVSALAVQNEKRRRELETANKKIAKLQAERDKAQEELNKIAGARSRVAQPSSAGPNGQPGQAPKRKPSQSVDQAFNDFFGKG